MDWVIHYYCVVLNIMHIKLIKTPITIFNPTSYFHALAFFLSLTGPKFALLYFSQIV
jgi:hypothetical protein